MFKNLIIIILAFLIWLSYFSKSFSSEQSNQYCDIKTTLIKTVDKEGNIIDETLEEKVVCNDGVKNFLQNAGIADECNFYTYYMSLGGQLVERRSLACHKLDGGYEIIPGYSSSN